MGTFTDEEQQKLRPLLDDLGRLSRWPAKRKTQLIALRYLADKFAPANQYDEREVSAVLEGWHTFGDVALLRRDLVDAGLLERARDGSEYRRPST